MVILLLIQTIVITILAIIVQLYPEHVTGTCKQR